MKKLFYLFVCIFAFALYSCSETPVGGEDGSGTEDLTSNLESLYGKIENVAFGESNVTVYFASGKEMKFDYPEVVFPYVGENGNWWINGKDTGLKAAGADGEDGKDGVDGEDGQDGATGSTGAAGEDGEDGKDGADGQNGADGKDGVGISNITYEDGKLTITLTDGTSNEFELGISTDGSLVGTPVEDYLSDENPMMISAVKCGDVTMMNFEYDAQNRLVAAQYNTTEFNEEVPMFFMEREYTSATSPYSFRATVGEMATFDGQTRRVSDDYYESNFPNIDFADISEVYTGAELLNKLCPNGVSVNYNADGNDIYETHNIKIGQAHGSIPAAIKEQIDSKILECMACDNFREMCNAPFITFNDDEITVYMVCRLDYAVNLGLYSKESLDYDPYADDYSKIKYVVFEQSCPNNQDLYRDCYYNGNPVYRVWNINGSTRVEYLPIGEGYVYPNIESSISVGVSTETNDVWLRDVLAIGGNSGGYGTRSTAGYIYMPMSQAISSGNMVEVYNMLNYYSYEVAKTDGNGVEVSGNGDGYVEYTAQQAFCPEEGVDVLYVSDDKLELNTKYVMPGFENTYRVYEKGAMMDGGVICFTEDADGTITGNEEEYDEDKMIFAMNSNGTINKIIVQYEEEEWYEDVVGDYNGDGVIDDNDNINFGGNQSSTRSSADSLGHNVTIERDTVATLVYDGSERLTSITIHSGSESYADLFSIVYDANNNPVKITANGAKLKAIDDESVDFAMVMLGVASERSVFDPATGEFTTKYAYKTDGATELLNAKYNVNMKNFFGHSLDALTFMPFGLKVNNAIEEITWAGHASYLFSEYSDFNTAGYPTSAKLSAAYNPFEIYEDWDSDESYAGPVLTGISAGVSFEYTPMKK